MSSTVLFCKKAGAWEVKPLRPDTMEINRNKTVAFSGHRTSKIDIGTAHLCTQIFHTIRDLYEKYGYDTFISGMSIGFDTLAALAVLDLQAIYPDVKLVAAVPFMGHELNYSCEDKETYDEIVAQCTDIMIVSECFSYSAYFERNDYMLSNCSTLVCYFNGSAGSAKYTVEKAHQEGLHVINLYP